MSSTIRLWQRSSTHRPILMVQIQMFEKWKDNFQANGLQVDAGRSLQEDVPGRELWDMFAIVPTPKSKHVKKCQTYVLCPPSVHKPAFLGQNGWHDDLASAESQPFMMAPYRMMSGVSCKCLVSWCEQSPTWVYQSGHPWSKTYER